MALLTVATISGTASAPNKVAVNTTDTISASDIGDRGVILEVLNSSGGAITVSVSDAGTTPAGNPGTVTAQSVPAAGTRRIYVGPKNVNPATAVATLTYSSATSVTAEAYRF